MGRHNMEAPLLDEKKNNRNIVWNTALCFFFLLLTLSSQFSLFFLFSCILYLAFNVPIKTGFLCVVFFFFVFCVSRIDCLAFIYLFHQNQRFSVTFSSMRIWKYQKNTSIFIFIFICLANVYRIILKSFVIL